MTGDRQGKEGKGQDRYEWVDAARGIGIIAVVIAHVWTRGPVRDALYSFHMPLFFLLSGYLFRPHPPLEFARRQAATQGLTYGLYLAILVVADMVIEGMRGHRPIFSHWPADLWPILMGGSFLRGPFTVFWFIPCLMIGRILQNMIAHRFPNPLGRGWLMIVPVSLVMGLWIGARTDMSPLGLLTVPVALFLLWAGAAGRVMTWHGRLLILLLPLSLAGLFYFPPVNMKAGDYGWPILSLAGAIATSVLLFRGAQWRCPGVAALRSLGQSSLVIMYLHVPIAHYLTPVMGKWPIFAFALAVPYILYRLFRLNRLTTRLFLGL